MRILLFLIPLFIFADDLIIKFTNLKPFYYENQIVNLKLKVISPFNDLNISATQNIVLEVNKINPFIYFIQAKFQVNKENKFIFITSKELNKTINVNSLFKIKKLEPIPYFSHVLAQEINITSPVAVKTKAGLTPLHIAMKLRNTQMMQLLLDAGADVDAQDERGNTILHLAVKKHNFDLVRFCVNHQADVDLENDEGITPLHQAAFMGEDRIAEFLLLSGADASLKNEAGYSAYDMALYKNNLGMIEILKRR